METLAQHRCFGGTIGFFAHEASSLGGLSARFAVFVPDGATEAPALYALAGLTCTQETFLTKSGALRDAAAHGLVLVAPDTSPRGAGIEGEDADWDFGTGAGFYLDATQAPWSRHYRMGTYVSRELPALIEERFPVSRQRRGITGHSMGGHGALTLGLADPAPWQSVSAFAPICNPAVVPWGEKAFGRYLGADRTQWAQHDASLLLRGGRIHPEPILVDQGEADSFLDAQLHPDALDAAAAVSGQALTLRRHAGYDHSYWFIQSFIADHLAHHARLLHRP